MSVGMGGEAPENATGDPAFQIDLVTEFKWAGVFDAALMWLNRLSPELGKFFCQNGFKSARTW